MNKDFPEFMVKWWRIISPFHCAWGKLQTPPDSLPCPLGLLLLVLWIALAKALYPSCILAKQCWIGSSRGIHLCPSRVWSNAHRLQVTSCRWGSSTPPLPAFLFSQTFYYLNDGASSSVYLFTSVFSAIMLLFFRQARCLAPQYWNTTLKGTLDSDLINE